MAKFIVSGNVEIYTSHGSVNADIIYNEFINQKIKEDFKIAGFFEAAEVLSSIKSIEKIKDNKQIVGRFKAIGVQDVIMSFHEDQKAMTACGKFIDIEKTNPGDLLLSLNGLLEVDYVEIQSSEDEKEIYDFYVIETNNALPTLYVNNLVILPILEVEVKNPFFEHYQYI